jgi:tetratricopeptide (TPR) repeat protein
MIPVNRRKEIMKAGIIITLFSLIISGSTGPGLLAGQELKRAAMVEFEAGNYPAAIRYLKEAKLSSPGDPEIYYYLGYFTHYLCYDSIPLSGFDLDRSDEVLRYLRRAVELDPEYGNAYYFIGAECGARARIKMTRGDIEGAREEYRRGRSLGGFPEWLIEYGRNILKSCSRNAILFLGGDADTNPVEYLRLVEGYRSDVTAIPVALLNRPWFIKRARDGIPGMLPPAPVSWSDFQIMNMHNYKWKPNQVEVEISREAMAEYGIEKETFCWELEPDLSEGLLSPGNAALADIIATNRFERDIYFSLACGDISGLGENMQLCGLAMKLVPVPAPGTAIEVDAPSARKVLLDDDNYSSLPSVPESEMPRVSNILMNYPAALLRLCAYHLRRGEKKNAADIFGLIDQTGMKQYINMSRLESHIETYRKMAAE